MHGQNATDLANKLGSPVLASAEGVVRVAKSGSYNFGYGNYIIISHPNGTETLYAHNQTLLVSPGQTVSKGQQIATIGSTGNSTGPHVHFEIRGAYNPFAW
jgi:murein DD-endopeptidase MepM/ murein hydrolase activator NlpD